MGDKEPPVMHIQHDNPPTFYCWRYWMDNGEMREGCTPIEPHNNWPDLNDYGWIYIAIPIALLFLVIFLTYCICSKGSSKAVPKKPLIEDMSDSEEEIDDMPRNNRGQVIHAVPVRKSTQSELYTVVQMSKPDNNAAQGHKVPLHGGISPPITLQHPDQARLYPKLSTIKKKSNATNPPRVVDGRIVKSALSNEYAEGPASIPRSNGRRNNQATVPHPTKVLEETDSQTEEEITDHEIESEDENQRVPKN